MSSVVPQIISSEKFSYYKNLGHVISNKEIQSNIDTDEKEREELIIESQKRKSKFNKIDAKRLNTSNQRLNEVLSEARKRTMHLLQRAYNLKMEQEEDIQKCSRFILETKCRAVRDAQVSFTIVIIITIY